MTQEEKAKAYDEAIKRAKNCLDEKRDTCLVRPDVIFPELQESEDEKIRKELIQLIGCMHDADSRKKVWMTWLEKQGQVKESSISQHENKTCKENSNSLTGKDEQKPADNIEPKFKVGDWITNGEYTWKVTDIKSLDYILQSQDGNIVDDTISFVDYNCFRLWSINDAKEGDVLVSPATKEGNKESPFIFKEIDKNGVVRFHAALLQNKDFEISNDISNVMGYANAGYHIPATKEQRDLLFKKMKDAGYEWDAENKESKLLITNGGDFLESENCEQKYAKLDKKDDTTISIENEEAYKIGFSDGKAHAKEEMTSAWSEEDDEMVEDIIEAIDTQYASSDYNEMVNWLLSLKDRYTWKPSDEQMKALNYVVNLMASSESPKENDYYYNVFKDLRIQLKKLREG